MHRLAAAPYRRNHLSLVTSPSQRVAAATPYRTGIQPVMIWAGIGALILLLQLHSMGSWILSDRFMPTPTGPDPIPDAVLLRLRIMEVCSALTFVFLVTYFVVRPWRRDGRPSFDGLLIVSWGLMTWQDPMVNYISTQYLLNSHLINFGSWTAGSVPGWVSPNGNLLPEPVVLYPAIYMLFGIIPVATLCAAWRWYRRTRPQASFIGYVLITLAIGIMLDLIAEVLMIRGGVFAYPNAIRSVTLWAGELHQFPLYEGLLVCFVMTAGACLRFFVNDKGETWVERGLGRLQMRRSEPLLRFLAIYAFIQLSMLLLYSIPMMGISMHTDTFVEGYPSYMVNGLCVSGAEGSECPGRGVPMPRP